LAGYVLIVLHAYSTADRVSQVTRYRERTTSCIMFRSYSWKQ